MVYTELSLNQGWCFSQLWKLFCRLYTWTWRQLDPGKGVSRQHSPGDILQRKDACCVCVCARVLWRCYHSQLAGFTEDKARNLVCAHMVPLLWIMSLFPNFSLWPVVYWKSLCGLLLFPQCLVPASGLGPLQVASFHAVLQWASWPWLFTDPLTHFYSAGQYQGPSSLYHSCAQWKPDGVSWLDSSWGFLFLGETQVKLVKSVASPLGLYKLKLTMATWNLLLNPQGER